MGKIPGTPFRWPVHRDEPDRLIVSPAVFAEYQKLIQALSAGSYSPVQTSSSKPLVIEDLKPVMENVLFDPIKLRLHKVDEYRVAGPDDTSYILGRFTPPDFEDEAEFGGGRWLNNPSRVAAQSNDDLDWSFVMPKGDKPEETPELHPEPIIDEKKCTACWTALLPELDAYYGLDLLGPDLCAPCRKKLGIK